MGEFDVKELEFCNVDLDSVAQAMQSTYFHLLTISAMSAI